jgi:hypothetical protein
MKGTTLLLLAIAVLVPSVHAQTPPPGCKGAGKVCDVIVGVDGCTPNPNPDPVQPSGIKDVVIHWWIDDAAASAGFTFAPNNGVVPPADPSQFSPLTVVTSKHVHVKDKNTNSKSYDYSINLLKKGVPCKGRDPTIVNG